MYLYADFSINFAKYLCPTGSFLLGSISNQYPNKTVQYSHCEMRISCFQRYALSLALVFIFCFNIVNEKIYRCGQEIYKIQVYKYEHILSIMESCMYKNLA